MPRAKELKPAVLFLKADPHINTDKLLIVIEKIIEDHYPDYMCVTYSGVMNNTDEVPEHSQWNNHFTDQTLFVIVKCDDYPIADYGYKVHLTTKDSADQNVQPMLIAYKEDEQNLAEISLVCIENTIEVTNPTVCDDVELLAALENFKLTE